MVSLESSVQDDAMVSFSFDAGRQTLNLRGQEITAIMFNDQPDLPWFPAKPIILFLGYDRTSQTLERVASEDKVSLDELIRCKGDPIGGGLENSPPLGYNDGKAIWINEYGLYKLVIGSHKPEAEPFQRWITREVLPALRRHGYYVIEHKRRRIDEVDHSDLRSQQAQITQFVQPLQEAIVALQNQISTMQEQQRINAVQIQNSQQGALQHVAAVAGERHCVEVTSSNVHRDTYKREQEEYRRVGVPLPNQPHFLDEIGHLPVTHYLAERISDNTLVTHMRTPFSKQLKKLKDAEIARTGEKPFILEGVGGHLQYVYTENDRCLMNTLFEHPDTESLLNKLKERFLETSTETPTEVVPFVDDRLALILQEPVLSSWERFSQWMHRPDIINFVPRPRMNFNSIYLSDNDHIWSNPGMTTQLPTGVPGLRRTLGFEWVQLITRSPMETRVAFMMLYRITPHVIIGRFADGHTAIVKKTKQVEIVFPTEWTLHALRIYDRIASRIVYIQQSALEVCANVLAFGNVWDPAER
jgi:prophage antirepressor-like protein